MEMPANSEFKPAWSYYYNSQWQQFSFIAFLKELEIYGIQEFDHFKKPPGRNDVICWNEKYNVN